MPTPPAEPDEKMDPAKALLADNLKRLMRDSRDLRTIKQLSEASGVSTGTIDRLRRGEVAAQIDTLRQLAGAFSLEAWQLLVPQLDTTNPPMLAAESDGLKALYANLQTTAEAIKGHLRGDGNTGPGELDQSVKLRVAVSNPAEPKAGMSSNTDQEVLDSRTKKKGDKNERNKN